MNRAAHWDSERVILQYESLWREDGSPNLHDFLRTLPVYPSADTIGELCRVDLEHRHRRRIPISLDVYLSDFPEAFESSESIQDFREFAAEMDSIRTASASATSQPPHESFQIE